MMKRDIQEIITNLHGHMRLPSSAVFSKFEPSTNPPWVTTLENCAVGDKAWNDHARSDGTVLFTPTRFTHFHVPLLYKF